MEDQLILIVIVILRKPKTLQDFPGGKKYNFILYPDGSDTCKNFVFYVLFFQIWRKI